MAEHEQVDGVAEAVSPPTVQKDRDEWGETVDRVVVDHARHPRSDGYRVSDRCPVGELARHHSQVAHGSGQRLWVEPGLLDEQPHSPRHGQEEVGHHRPARRP